MTIFAVLQKAWPDFKMNRINWLSRLFVLNLFFTMTFAVPAMAAPNQCQDLFMPQVAATAPTREFKLWNYYLDKLREAKQLDKSAPLAMSLRFLILVTANPSVKEFVPVSSLKQIHPITREAAQEKLDDRIEALLRMPKEILAKPIPEEVLNQYIPSKNSIRAIETDDGDFVVFDGNGRLVAMEKSLPPETQVEIEVFRSKSRLLQAVLRKLRTMRNVQ